MRLAIVFVFAVGLLLVDPVCRGLAAVSTGEVQFGRLASPPALSPYRAEPDSRLGADALQSPIAGEQP